MKLDTASRSFVSLAVLSFIAYVAIAFAACLLVALAAYRLSADGLGAVTEGGQSLRAGLVFLLLVAAGVALGLRSLGAQMIASAKLCRRVRSLALPMPVELIAAARRARLSGRVKLVDADESFAFAYGAFSPRVAVSRGLLEDVAPAELDAVLEHERYHVVSLDPLKIMLFGAILSAFFLIPALRGYRARYVAGRELAADRRALEAHGRPPLAGALIKVMARQPGWTELRTAAAIGGSDLLDLRVAQLESGREPKISGASATAVLLSALGLGVLAWGFTASVSGFGGPAAVVAATMPGMELAAPALALAALCPAPLAVAGVAGYGWLSWRAGRELDTTSM